MKETPLVASYGNLGSHYELQIVEALLDELGHPEEQLDIIHVSGTNGKGSTISYMMHAYVAAGFECMSFTSPQVRTYLERFIVNGQAVSQLDFDHAEASVLAAAERIAVTQKRHATVFEMELAIALIIAKNLGIRLFLMETGLGGRLDATNAVKQTMATVFTSISLDHKEYLGDTKASVATEKAGIIKHEVPVFSTVQVAEVAEVLLAQSSAMSAPIHFLSVDEIEIVEETLLSQSFRYEGYEYTISMLGHQQIYNAALAVMVLRNLPLPYQLASDVIRMGLANSKWYGSFEVLTLEPEIVLDGAHNQEAAEVLASNLRDYRNIGKCYGILHIFKDKDVAAILLEMRDIFDGLFLPDKHHPRSLPARELQKLCRQYLPLTECIVKDTVADAVRAVSEIARPEDTIVVFGSLSHLEEARQLLVKIYLESM